VVEVTPRVTTALIAFASTLLLTAPSYATEKITLACVGTVQTDSGGTNADPGESLVIDLDQGIVAFGDKNVPISKNEGNAISFENNFDEERDPKKEKGEWVIWTIDRVVGTAVITEHLYTHYGENDFYYDLTCKRTNPVF
jgi:hypothetical protein